MKKKVIGSIAMMGLLAGAAHAGLLVGSGSTFTASDVSGGAFNIDTTGANIVDWGYYDKTTGASSTWSSDPSFDNSKASSGIGSVVVTPGAVDGGTATFPVPTPWATVTFDDGSSPAAGTDVLIGERWGAWAGTEDNAFNIVFNDLGVGTHTVTLFVGHTDKTRVLDMDYSLSASDGNLSGNTISSNPGSGTLFTYSLEFSTTDALADLTLQLNSTSGGAGSGLFGGYTVSTIPEPATIGLVAVFGGGVLFIRRRFMI